MRELLKKKINSSIKIIPMGEGEGGLFIIYLLAYDKLTYSGLKYSLSSYFKDGPCPPNIISCYSLKSKLYFIL